MRMRPPLPGQRRKHLVAFLGVVLFFACVGLAILLATPGSVRLPRFSRGGDQGAVQYRLDPRSGTMRVRGEVAPGRAAELEVVGTEQGVLIRPVQPNP